MDHRVPKIGALISVLLAIGATITFIFLNQKFEGPDPVGFIGSPYELTATFENSKTLPSKQPVLHKGVSVGRVNSVDYDAETQQAVVTFTLTEEIAPLHADAKLQIGERSLLGDAYLNLLDPGTEAAPELEAGDELAKTVPSVNFDEALDFLDEDGRRRVRNLIDEVSDGLSPQGNGYRLNGTVGGVSGTLTELRKLTDALRGQEEQIATLVSDSATVLDELGSRERAVRSIVSSGRTTLDALASNTDSLQQGIAELPPLLDSGRATLQQSRPLIAEALPLVRDLRELSPRLVPAFDEGAPFAIGPISKDLIDTIELLEPQRKASERYLPQVARLSKLSQPLVRGAGPASLNTVPVADYLAPRIGSVGAFYGLGASVIANEDDVGRYARFAIIGDPALLADNPTDGQCDPVTGAPTVPGPGYCYNAYPLPNDALDNQPFVSPYPRLEAFEPPPRHSVIKGR